MKLGKERCTYFKDAILVHKQNCHNCGEYDQFNPSIKKSR